MIAGQTRQTIDFPQAWRNRRRGAVADTELGIQMLERAFQRELERRRCLDEMERLQPAILRKMQPFLPRIEMIEKPQGRDFHGFPLRQLAQGCGQIRRDFPLAHPHDRVLADLPKRAADFDPRPGCGIGNEQNRVLSMFRRAE